MKHDRRKSLGFNRRICQWVIMVSLVIIAACQTWAQDQVDKPSELTETCATSSCHPTVIDHKVAHGPVIQQKCLACHQPTEPRDHQFELAAETGPLCESCHTISHKTMVHKPVADGNCTGCHAAHGSEHRLLLVDDPTRDLCLNCHKKNFSDKEYVHGPVASGACILCHEAHSSWEPKLLIKPAKDLCMDCHAELAAQADEARHVHQPVTDGDCSTCHDPHASDNRFQLKQASPQICYNCHDDIKQQLADANVIHAAATDEGGCAQCHAPHFSPLPKLQRQVQPELCLSCHDKTLEATDGQELINMKALLADNPEHHGPIRTGGCSECHYPHGSKYFRLLTEQYPPEFYASFDAGRYQLCFNCHISQMVTDENGKGLTRFRKDGKNLHWLHVNRPKGRSCRACHEVHASNNPFHIRDSVPFGDSGWQLELKFKRTETGGSCTPGCHKLQNYDSGGDELLIKSSSDQGKAK